jgi:hypothetical protein
MMNLWYNFRGNRVKFEKVTESWNCVWNILFWPYVFEKISNIYGSQRFQELSSPGQKWVLKYRQKHNFFPFGPYIKDQQFQPDGPKKNVWNIHFKSSYDVCFKRIVIFMYNFGSDDSLQRQTFRFFITSKLVIEKPSGDVHKYRIHH